MLDYRSALFLFYFFYILDLGTSNANLHITFLQNGEVLVFDMRQTAGPLKSFAGLTSNPVHSLQSLAQTTGLSSGVRTILSASAIGACQWDIDSDDR
jgi:E3 ubiquitin-protein ligase RFWD3